MNSLILIRTSLRAITQHKGRSLLTILGIMIGIAAIIVTFSIGSGAEQKIRKQIVGMGEGAIYIIRGNVLERGTIRSNLAQQPKLTVGDLEAIKHQCRHVLEISRGHETHQLIEFGKNSARDAIGGVDANLLSINNNTIKLGDFFNEFHVQNRSNVAVLGSEMAKKLFKNESPLNQTIHINKIPFTVIGVLNRLEFYFGAHDPNNHVMIPFTVADKYFRLPELKSGDLGFIALRISDQDITGQTLREIKRILRFRHNIAEGDSDDFMIFDEQSIAQAAQQASGVIKLFGLIAASISLLVGGIGVMNIMLVSVQERTREIGIRIALGATQGIVQRQFLIEAVVLSAFGGIIGVFMGLGMQYFLSQVTELPVIIETTPILLSFLATIMVGIFFGYYPARKASLLNPVEALLEK